MLKAALVFAVLTSFASQASPALYRISKNNVTSHLFGIVDEGGEIKAWPTEVKNLFEAAPQVAIETAYTSDEVALYRTNPEAFYLNLVHPQVPPSHAPLLDQQTARRLTAYGIPARIAASFHQDECAQVALPTLHNMFEGRYLGVEINERLQQENKKAIALSPRGLKAAAVEAQIEHQGEVSCSVQSELELASPQDFVRIEKVGFQNYQAGNQNFFDQQSSEWSRLVVGYWLNTLNSQLSRTSTFVAVPMVYLGGESGLVESLRDSGFTVVREKIPEEVATAQ